MYCRAFDRASARHPSHFRGKRGSMEREKTGLGRLSLRLLEMYGRGAEGVKRVKVEIASSRISLFPLPFSAQ
jgi:hypothetical protein